MAGFLWMVAWGMMAVGLVLLLSKLVARRFNKNKPVLVTGDECKMAVLIPARDESAVIGGLLDSLARQSVILDFKNVYVIVERQDDPTVEICKEYGAEVIVRQNLAGQRKGYALAEGVEKILDAGKHYDVYFFFDADNRLTPNYLERMRKVYFRGYDMGVGRRRILNPKTAVAVGSGLIFTIINGIVNKSRSQHQMNCIISGTGFYIAGRILEKMGTYPFHSLTEDYELSLYATVEGLATYYAASAEFYDEQPESYAQYFRQRTRWVKGYFEARKEFRGRMWRKLKLGNGNFVSVYDALIGIYDILLMVIVVVLMMVAVIINGDLVWFNLLGILAVVYLVLMIFSVILLGMERLKLSFKLEIMVILIHPLLLVTYVPCFVVAICRKDVGWKRIEHKG